MSPNTAKLLYMPKPRIRALRDENGRLHIEDAPPETEIRPDCLFMDGVLSFIKIQGSNGNVTYRVTDYDPHRNVLHCSLVRDHTE